MNGMISSFLFAAVSWKNVSDNDGVAIAITGMIIVFLALVLISLFIAALPHILGKLEPFLPKLEHHQSPQTAAESLPTDEEKIVAAIGFVLHQEMQKASKK